ncbi:Nucleosomal histone kinase 1 [Cryptotermes secundus]|nr:serine/threonine-protein kinase VRK1 isoform X2 [Cryptotermes secundus]XP_023718316.1 serine/threonine-protein kinase VRK1 isoform X2 [Cryptotermes secundus]PNF22731.1 Nucleosomal histone kinase 1 [Cryptotermes secundus]PNF22732.1 Nucleosomal histone kinase 1 [Cryptotermes secundus]
MSKKPVKPMAMKKTARQRKAANGYKLPDPIPVGEIVRDVTKKEWQIGPSIGIGGFGEIYAASDVSHSPRKKAALPYVIKIEPHGNGPLFVEMHFYMKVAKPDQIEEWKKQKKLKSLGMPRYLGSGSHECNGLKYRFVVMDRYGKDLWSLFLQNKRVFMLPAVLRVGLQIIDVLEYIHSKMYVHADIKGGNLLLGFQKGTENQVYLVDFGLASHYSQKEYKPDPKKAHNGTIEYTSRDAHVGVPTRRGDLEILAYNMLQWLTSKLPWENNLSDPLYVHQQKSKYMDNIPELMKKCFPKTTPPAVLVKYFQYVASLRHDADPDYEYCQKLLKKGLKDLNCSVGGNLDLSAKAPVTRSSPTKANNKIPSSDDKATASDTEPHNKKKVVASGTGNLNRTKQLRDHFSGSSSSDESDYDKDNADNYSKKAKLCNTNKKTKTNPVPSWRDCPTAIASNVNRAGEYKRINHDNENQRVKKQKKKTDA